MKRRVLGWIFGILALGLTLQACGHGGTEVGNPPGPQVPSSGAPGIEDDGASPSPSPEAGLHFDDDTGENHAIDLSNEETES